MHRRARSIARLKLPTKQTREHTHVLLIWPDDEKAIQFMRVQKAFSKLRA
jgi:hypothetical protein